MPQITYTSPLGEMLLISDGDSLTGAYFEAQKRVSFCRDDTPSQLKDPALIDAERWLDVYFSGQAPDFMPRLCFNGTEFQNEVWRILTRIPYGKTATYGEIAELTAKNRGISKMSARAVGKAVGQNPISIIVPCHRVTGSDGSLTGYAWGLDRKSSLLELEGFAIAGSGSRAKLKCTAKITR